MLLGLGRRGRGVGYGPVEAPAEMLGDRDPDTGERFPTVAAMREAKLRDWEAGAARVGNMHHVSCRDYYLDRREMLERVEKGFGLKRRAPEWDLGGCLWHFGGCISPGKATGSYERQRRKRDYYLNMEHMRAFTDETLAIANAWLDPELFLATLVVPADIPPDQLEARFGYSLFDKVANAMVPYTKESRCEVHGAC